MRRLVAVAAAFIVALLAGATPAGAATIKVNSIADQFGSGDSCTLREAVQTANTNAAFGGCVRSGGGADLIGLQSGRTYLRSIAGPGDDNSSGDLDISSDLTMRPLDRQGRATIDAEGLSRVIDVFGASKVTIGRVNLVGGATQAGDLHEGGGALVAADSSLRLSRVAVARNTAGLITTTGVGGGISSAGTLTLDRVLIKGNSTPETNMASNGGGIFASAGEVTITRSKVISNRVANVAGGIENDGAKLMVTDSTISGNHAGYVGGGIFNYLGMNLNRVTISGNESGSNGAGIYQDTGFSGTARGSLINVTIDGNRSDADGGGIYARSGQVILNNATVTRNAADADGNGSGDGGGLVGSVFFHNSIVFGNADLSPNPTDRLPQCWNAYSQGNNLLGTAAGCGSADGDVVATNARLGPLQLNGGITETRALSRKSPAVDAASPKKPGVKLATTGACAARDQRDVKRPQGRRCDIGAFEFRPPKR